MSCNKCDEYDESGCVAYYRWGTASIGIIACDEHAIEIFEALNKAQSLP